MVSNLKIYLKNEIFNKKTFIFLFLILSLLSSYSFINSTIPIYLISLLFIFFNLNKIEVNLKNLFGVIFF